MAPEQSAPPLRRRFPSRRREVQEETALRPGVGFADGRNNETGKGRSGANTNRHLRDRVAAYKKYFPNADQQTVADTRKVTAAVLDKLAEQHPNDAAVVDYAKKDVTEATDFVKRHDVVGIPNVPLDVIAMPEFKRGVAIAYCDAPGPLEKNGKTFFAVAPTPKD